MNIFKSALLGKVQVFPGVERREKPHFSRDIEFSLPQKPHRSVTTVPLPVIQSHQLGSRKS